MMDESKNHREYVQGLRALADFYEAHPEVPLPYSEQNIYALDTKDEAKMLAEALGTFEKEYNEWHFTMVKRFGPIQMRFVFNRGNVCTKKVVGVKTIPAEFVEAHTRPARTEEIVEWDCPDSLLDHDTEARQAQERG